LQALLLHRPPRPLQRRREPDPMLTMTDMEMDDEDQLDAIMPIAMPDKPRFPYGLRICLTEKEFEKLGLDPRDAIVGGICHGHFLARVTDVHAAENDGGSSCRVELQIEDLAIESEDEEDKEN
jgi:hypothetical protein